MLSFYLGQYHPNTILLLRYLGMKVLVWYIDSNGINISNIQKYPYLTIIKKNCKILIIYTQLVLIECLTGINVWLGLISTLQIGVAFILHGVMLGLPTMVHICIVGVTGSTGHLKVVGTEGLGEKVGEEQWAIKLPCSFLFFFALRG